MTATYKDEIQYVVFMVTNMYYNDLDAKFTEYVIEHVFNSYPTSGHGLEMAAENMALAEQLLWEYIEKYLDSVNA